MLPSYFFKIGFLSTFYQEYGFVHLSAGELLRQARDSPGSEFASEIQEHMKNGTIVPAEITCGLLYQVGSSFIFGGYFVYILIILDWQFN